MVKKFVVKSIARKTIVPLAYKFGYYHRLLHREGKSRAIILMYHNITTHWRNRFEEQMRFLQDYMYPISLNELVDSLRGKGQFPPQAIAITFDDGYESVYNIAFPILRKYSIPATVFLVTGYIETDKVFWWDEIRGMGEFSPHEEFREKLGSVLKRQMPQVEFSTWKNFEVEKYLARLKDAEIRHILEQLRTELRSTIRPKRTARLLSWQQIREMHKDGIEFGSHTVNHYNLTTISEEEVEEELKASKEKIEEELDEPVTGFCYPIGLNEHYNEKVKELVAKRGYRYACTAEFGHVSKGSNLFLLRRVCAGNEPLAYFVRSLVVAISETSDSVN